MCTLIAFVELETGESKLLDVVQSLGEYLTDDDATVRAKGMLFLSIPRKTDTDHSQLLRFMPASWQLLTQNSLRDSRVCLCNLH